MEHHVELIEGLAVAGMWTGLCSCGRLTGDNPFRQATQLEAEEHERDPDPPVPEPWHPGRHPTPNR